MIFSFAGGLRLQREAIHVKLTTYLNFGGRCEEAFKFYEQHLGGKITMLPESLVQAATLAAGVDADQLSAE